MDTLRELVAGELRATLARKRISAAELARRLGWSQSYTARRVDGRNAIDMDDLQRIAEVLEVEPADLLPTRVEQGEGRLRGRYSSGPRTPVSLIAGHHDPAIGRHDPVIGQTEPRRTSLRTPLVVH